MNCKKTYISVGLMLYGLSILAQRVNSEKKQDTINSLNEVTVFGKILAKENEIKGQKVVVLPNYAVVRNATNPTETLRFNSPIALRDFGNGGISTARFRGTSPTNTAVLWNGIPINSAGNGLTDFNTIALNTTDEVKIVSGGASVLYGTGAIGGVVLLNDDLKFSKHQNFQLFSQYGSFNTSSNYVKANLGDSKWALKIAGAYNSSDNDYEYIDGRFVDENGGSLFNENGNYKNYNLDVSLGYKVSNNNKIYLYSQVYESDRSFSAGIPNPSAGRERNQDFSQRNLLKWDTNFGKFNQSVKLAHLALDYTYFNNQFSSTSDFSETQNTFFDYHVKYNLSQKLQLSYLLNANFSSIETNFISRKNRRAIAMVGLLHYQPFKNTATTLSFRNEENTDFNVPLALNFGVEQQLLSFIKLKGNYSTNFRTPTFNEQFWPRVGNPDLLPEVSKQFELGFQIQKENLNFQASYFNIQIDDKILWLPSSGSNLWKPRNIKNTSNKGVEVSGVYSFQLLTNHVIKLSTNYTYTMAKNLENNRRLPFAPEHLWNFNVDYTYQRLNMFFQGLQQSRSFTTEDSVKFFSLDPAEVYNVGVNIDIVKTETQQLTMGAKINNVTNSLYYFTNLRPNPGRNYSIQINYKF